MEILEPIFAAALALGGAAALIAALVNVGKQIGVVPDGKAPTASLLLNLVLFVGVALAGVFAPTLDLVKLDGIAGDLAQILTLAFGIATQFGLTKQIAEALKGAPVIGFSHSK